MLPQMVCYIRIEFAYWEMTKNVSCSFKKFCGFDAAGLFVEDWHFPYSLSTLSTCQVVRVRLEDIETTTHAWLEVNTDNITLSIDLCTNRVVCCVTTVQ